ncbi:hypothetical protein [Methylobacterium oxalidis]
MIGPQGGTTVRLLFPARPAPAPVQAGKPAETPAALPGGLSWAAT